jgi:uncharacterized membrane protein
VLLTIQEHCDAVVVAAAAVVVVAVAYEDMVVAVDDAAASASAYVLLGVHQDNLRVGCCSSCLGVVAVTYGNPSWKGVHYLGLPWVAFRDAPGASC